MKKEKVVKDVLKDEGGSEITDDRRKKEEGEVKSRPEGKKIIANSWR